MVTIDYTTPTAQEWQKVISYTDWKPQSIEVLEHAIQNSLYFVTAYDNGCLVGLMQIVGDGIMSYYFQYLVVIPDYRNRGIASKIVKKALEKSLEKFDDDGIIALFTSVKNQSFYEKLNFKARPNESQGPAMIYVGNN